MHGKIAAAARYSSAAWGSLIHAARQAHNVEDFGGDLFHGIIGTVEIANLVSAKQRFDFAHFEPTLAQRSITGIFRTFLSDSRQAFRVDCQAKQFVLMLTQGGGNFRLSMSSAING